jgi:site-specific DNA-adenine methylase
MSKYHGGKKRVGKKIAHVIYKETLKLEDKNIKGYCEPFAGMLGVFNHIPELFGKKKYKIGEINESIVKMWKRVMKGWVPPTNISKDKFYKLKCDGKQTAEKGFVGHAFTFRGTYFDTYFKHPVNILRAAIKRIKILGDILKKNKVEIKAGSYKQFSNLKGFVIYCDPPYQGTEQRYYDKSCEYKDRLSFDSSEFWIWCKKMSKHNIVFVSEYKLPKDFKIVWSSGKEKLGMLY